MAEREIARSKGEPPGGTSRQVDADGLQVRINEQQNGIVVIAQHLHGNCSRGGPILRIQTTGFSARYHEGEAVEYASRDTGIQSG